jgi:hypothetical protein
VSRARRTTARAAELEGVVMQHRRAVWFFVRLAVVAVLSAAGLVAVAGASNANPVPFTQRTVKVSNAFVFGQCSIVINGTDFNGNDIGYIYAQSQPQLLGVFVKSTALYCRATNADDQFMADFTYVGTGPALLATRKNVTLPVSSTYHLCTTMTLYFYDGSSTAQTACA